jgi:hypothetical protein
MSEPTGRILLDTFLEELDWRIASPATPEHSKETLRRVRPAIISWARRDPAKAEATMLRQLDRLIDEKRAEHNLTRPQLDRLIDAKLAELAEDDLARPGPPNQQPRGGDNPH